MKRCPTCGAEFPLDAGFCPHDGKILVAIQDPKSPDPRLGTQVGNRFFLVAIVADGANGRVYEARETTTRTKYAVKVLHDHAAQDPTAVERFKREADTARSIDHPNVLKVYDFDRDPNVGFFLAMEFLDGESLGALLARENALTPGRTIRIASQIALALGAAHPRGFTHRDIKPDNVFIERGETGDEVRILDFGSVKRQEETGPKLTAMGTTLGSPYYMAPEQAKGLPTVDSRADVFSLGCIVYEMVTGKIAFDAPAVALILQRILSDSPTPPSFVRNELPEALDDVIRKALAKDARGRHATAGKFCEDLARSLGVRGGSPVVWARTRAEDLDAAIAGRAAGVTSAGSDTATRVLWVVFGIAGGIALLAGAGALALWLRSVF